MATRARRSAPFGVVAWIALVVGCDVGEEVAPREDAIEVEVPLRVEVPIDAPLDEGEGGVALWLPATTPRETGWSRPLRWLARHQARDGSWSSYAFGSWCAGTPCTGASVEDETIGVTGLALLAHFCAGETHKSPGHGVVVRSGLEFLKSVQGPDGSFARPWNSHPGLQNAWASAAVLNAYGMTNSPLFREPAEMATGFLQSSQLPGGGWRKEARGEEADLETTVWSVVALRTAQLVELEVHPATFDRARRWLDSISDPATGRVGADRRLEVETAMAVVGRRCSAQGQGSFEIALEAVSQRPPAWDPVPGAMDMRSWYFGTLCCYIRGVLRFGKPKSPATERSDRWAKGLRTLQERLPWQREGCGRGSLGPCEPWGREHGRVASTAMGAILESFWY
jgi:hypothetical protein